MGPQVFRKPAQDGFAEPQLGVTGADNLANEDRQVQGPLIERRPLEPPNEALCLLGDAVIIARADQLCQ